MFEDPALTSSEKTSSSTSSTPKNRVQFHGVEVREYRRSMGDNPVARAGPPLSLDWEYRDMTRGRNPSIQENSNNYSPCAVIPIDDYEKETERRRRAKLMEMCKLREQSMLQILGTKKPMRWPKRLSFSGQHDDSVSSEHPLSEEQKKPRRWSKRLSFSGQHDDSLSSEHPLSEEHKKPRRWSKRLSFSVQHDDSLSSEHPLSEEQKKPRRWSKRLSFSAQKDDSVSSEDTLSEEQIRQLSAAWLKIQPLTAKERVKIILKHTNCTRADIQEHEKLMRKVRSQRQTTKANIETGLDEWQSVFELVKRRFRRYKTGISKEREQELLWENADSYWTKIGRESASSSLTASTVSLRSSISSVSHYE